jgi:hypothetical protein
MMGGGFSPDEDGSGPDGFPDLTDAENAEVEKLLAKDPESLTKAERARVKKLTGIDLSDMSTDGGDFPALSDAENRELHKLMLKDTLTDADTARIDELMRKADTDRDLPDPAGPGADIDPEKYEQALGGATITVAANHVTGGDASARVVVGTTSAENATTLSKLTDLFGESMTVQTKGTTVTVTTKHYVAGPGALGDRPEFRAATADGPANPDFVAYVDLSSLVKPGDGTASPVKSVALVQSTTSGTVEGLIRLTVA